MKKSILSLVTTVALAGIAHAGSVTFTNWGVSFSQIQANGAPVAAGTGFIAVGTTALTPADLAADVAQNGGALSLDGRAALAASFIQFGDSITFGFSGFEGFSTIRAIPVKKGPPLLNFCS